MACSPSLLTGSACPASAVSPPSIAESDRQAVRRARRAEARAISQNPLLTAAESAAETGRALSTFWRDVKRGILPAPYYVTPRSPRWRLSELQAVIGTVPRSPVIR